MNFRHAVPVQVFGLIRVRYFFATQSHCRNFTCHIPVFRRNHIQDRPARQFGNGVAQHIRERLVDENKPGLLDHVQTILHLFKQQTMQLITITENIPDILTIHHFRNTHRTATMRQKGNTAEWVTKRSMRVSSFDNDTRKRFMRLPTPYPDTT